MIKNYVNKWIAVLLSIIFPGLGHYYVGQFVKACVLALINLICLMIIKMYFFNPAIVDIPILLYVLQFLFILYIIIDAYKAAVVLNKSTLDLNSLPNKKIVFLWAFTFICLQLAVSIIIKVFFVQSFKEPAISMEPTIQKDDQFLVDKQLYKKKDPQRGDIVVFIYSADKKKVYAKRIIGLPNETIEIKDGRILINHQVVSSPEIISKSHYLNKGDYGKEGKAIFIPENSYYVLGDNSEQSNDSRYWGFVKREQIIGKAYKIFDPPERAKLLNK